MLERGGRGGRFFACEGDVGGRDFFVYNDDQSGGRFFSATGVERGVLTKMLTHDTMEKT